VRRATGRRSRGTNEEQGGKGREERERREVEKDEKRNKDVPKVMLRKRGRAVMNGEIWRI
jgi:hypothetical protein